MLCQNCNQNEANVKYTQIVNGVKKEMLFCERCSKELGIDNMKLSLPISFSNFFGDFLHEYDNSFMPMMSIQKEVRCNKCGMTYNDFMKLGKFGCDNCYEVFSTRVDPILKRLQGSNRYTGRKAELNEYNNNINKIETKEKTTQEQIDELKKELKKMVNEENYEQAAKIRDDIKKLEVQD